jgi:hypothetical protein
MTIHSKVQLISAKPLVRCIYNVVMCNKRWDYTYVLSWAICKSHQRACWSVIFPLRSARWLRSCRESHEADYSASSDNIYSNRIIGTSLIKKKEPIDTSYSPLKLDSPHFLDRVIAPHRSIARSNWLNMLGQNGGGGGGMLGQKPNHQTRFLQWSKNAKD